VFLIKKDMKCKPLWPMVLPGGVGVVFSANEYATLISMRVNEFAVNNKSIIFLRNISTTN